MIILKATYTDKKFIPERELTSQEKITVTSVITDGSNNTIIYYQGDEPYNDVIPENPYREVPLWKVRAILKQMGLIPSIETALNGLPSETKDIALAAWEYSATINQYSPTVKLIQQSCALSDEQVQQIFDNAEKINI